MVLGLVACGSATLLFGGVGVLTRHATYSTACLLLRVLQGAGSAAVDTAAFAIIAKCYPC